MPIGITLCQLLWLFIYGEAEPIVEYNSATASDLNLLVMLICYVVVTYSIRPKLIGHNNLFLVVTGQHYFPCVCYYNLRYKFVLCYVPWVTHYHS
jgi:hypothetical protein